MLGPTLWTATILVLAAASPCVRFGPLSPQDAMEARRLRLEADALSQAIDEMRRAAGAVRLVVNGEEIPSAAIERTMVYAFGREALETKIGDLLVADEIDRRRGHGSSLEDLGIGAGDALEEVEAAKRRLEGEVAVPRIAGIWVASVGRAYLEEESSKMLFDRVFVPEDPAKWSETTIRTFVDEGGREFVEKTMKGLREHREKDPNEPMPGFYRTIFRWWTRKTLKRISTIRTASYGMPPEVVLTVNGRSLPTAEAYAAVARGLTVLDRERGLRWIVWATATRRALEEGGAYLSDEEFEKGRESMGLEAPYCGSYHGAEDIATIFKGFPAYDLYCEYRRLLKSFERAIEGGITEEVLEAHRDRVQDFYGDSTVDAQVILCSALDDPDSRWNGREAFDRARARAEEVVAALRTGTSFEEAIDRYSAFPRSPALVAGQRTPHDQRWNVGRFGPRTKNQLKALLGESEFDEIVRGYSIAEILFHDAPIGEAIGPIRGPFGYYVGRVLARHPAEGPIGFAPENWRNLVREDCVSRRFLEWSNEAVARSRIEVH